MEKPGESRNEELLKVPPSMLPSLGRMQMNGLKEVNFMGS